MKITELHAQEIFDSRGIPTIECELVLEDGMSVTASVPSGISCSMHEAYEMRDGGARLDGLGVQKALHVMETIIAPLIIDKEADIIALDMELVQRDDTDNKSQLGANTILATSIAVCRAQAYSENIPVFELIADLCHLDSVALPQPMFNFFGGGAHANNNFPIQELLVIPLEEVSFEQALNSGVELYHAVQKLLKKRGKSIAVGYEGEFVPQFSSKTEPFDLIAEAIATTNHTNNVMIGLDVAASSFYDISTGLYTWYNEKIVADELIEIYKQLIHDYPIYSIEDGLSEVDWTHWVTLKKELGSRVKLIGDDLFATNPQRIWTGIEKNVATTAVIKPNQIGTITETLQAIMLCKENNWDIVISHRAGETNDSFIADLAVGVSATHIKAGGCSRGERMSKYNQLLTIERKLLLNQIQH